jgi:hypothetical protein
VFGADIGEIHTHTHTHTHYRKINVYAKKMMKIGAEQGRKEGRGRGD